MLGTSDGLADEMARRVGSLAIRSFYDFSLSGLLPIKGTLFLQPFEFPQLHLLRSQHLGDMQASQG